MPVPAVPDEEIAAFLTDWRDRYDVPGVSVAVVDADGVRFADGFGVRDREADAPVTERTLFAVGSLAKPVTAMAVLQLVDRGDLALDDAVDTYVDVLSDAPGDPITVRELLSHSSGMPRDFVAGFLAEGDGDRWPYVDDAADQRLTDRPRYMYYNSGYFLLAAVLEAVDGRAFPEYVRDEVFDPLGMTRAGYGPDALADDDAMTGYRQGEDGLEPAPVDHDAGASGGLVCSAEGLAAVLECVLNGGTYGGTQLLTADLLEEACRLQSPTLPAAEGVEKGYGYGWELDQLLGERLVGHRGGLGVSGGYVGLLPERGVGVALAYNALTGPAVPCGQGVLALAAGEDPHDAVPLLGVHDAVETATGTYETYGSGPTVTVESGPAGTILVSLPFTSFTASPDAVDTEPQVFSQQMGGGVKWVAEFRDGGAELVLSTGKWTWRLTAADRGDRDR